MPWTDKIWYNVKCLRRFTQCKIPIEQIKYCTYKIGLHLIRHYTKLLRTLEWRILGLQKLKCLIINYVTVRHEITSWTFTWGLGIARGLSISGPGGTMETRQTLHYYTRSVILNQLCCPIKLFVIYANS